MQDDKDDAVGSSWSYALQHYLLTLAEACGAPAGQLLVSFFYGLYLRFTFSNIIIFSIKYIPPGYYMYKLLKDGLGKSHERLRHKQLELEDIQLKIEIVKTKLCVRDSEFSERAEILRREKERLRLIRFRVRNMIASDDALRRAMEVAGDGDEQVDLHLHLHSSTQEDEFATELLRCIKSKDRIAIPDRLSEQIECGEYMNGCEQASPENSIYSSLSDVDVRHDSTVKIVQVTNVYKVAYLKHYIKQKKLRRANKRALLNKKMGSIKKMMEDWQRTLNMVINTTVMNMELHPLDVTSQEAMGDYKLRDSSSEGDLRPYNDAYYNDNWMHSPHRPFSQYEEQEHGALRDPCCERDHCYEHDMSNGDIKCCECFGQAARKMHAILEETGSQVAIEEVSSDEESRVFADSRDLVAI